MSSGGLSRRREPARPVNRARRLARAADRRAGTGHSGVPADLPPGLPPSPWRGRPDRVRNSNCLRRIRAVVALIPRGRVMSYGRVAERAGFPRGARLTVWALQRSERLPWHRVVAAGGRIALPDGAGSEQRRRLRVEGVTFRQGRVRMDRHEWIPRGAPTVRGRRRGSPKHGGLPSRADPDDRGPR